MPPRKRKSARPGPMRTDLGRVDMCLNVKSIQRSYEFYRKLGFVVLGGNMAQKWLILRRGEFRLGIFQGHIDRNVINFRGGHVGNIVKALQERGLKPYKIRGLMPNGRGSAMIDDPDGNAIFFDSSSHERVARKRARTRK